MNARDKLYAYAGTPSVLPESMLDEALDAYRAEVLAEEGLLPKADVVTWLTKKARENTPVWQLASKVERGAVRPDNLRMLPPDFYEAGHTYTHVDDGTDWLFRVDTVTAHPERGERTALGWRHFKGQWEAIAYDEDDYEIHLCVGLIDITEGGEGR
ncbi:hypothetical protein ABTZ58_03890 [Streptomyces sp. NPDC094143]|uniref:hypothetical protein n=1 Tax=unclassified Streptomyces TaxID=2593676 RepID=UPI00331FD574